jgi:co-chaperonin GroES (HSP10)
MPVLDIVHDEDPADRIFDNAGDLDDFEVFNSNVLVGVYLRDGDGKKEAKTKGGLIVPNAVTNEDKFQSKMGVILNMGPSAFRDPNGQWFADSEFTIGDWVVFRPSDGWGLTLVSYDGEGRRRELLCRLIDDVAVRMRVLGPTPADRVY